MSPFELLLDTTPMRALGWTLIHFLWQGVVWFAVHEAAQWMGRRRSAAVRYLTACLVLAGMLGSAAVTLHLEMQRIPVGAGDVRAQAARSHSMAQDALDRTAREGATPPVVAWMPSDPHTSDPAQPAHVTPPAEGRTRSLGILVRPLSLLQARLPHLDVWLPWCVVLWFAGVFLLTTRLMLGWQETQWLRTRAVRPVDAATQQRLRVLLHRMRISRPVRVLESSLAEVPTVVGWLRPVVLLPTAAITGLPPQHLEALLAHELSHVRRHDYLVNLLQTLVETVLFYHPAVWWVSQRIRDEREHCCDDAAMQLCGDAVLYARALTNMEEMRRGAMRPELAMAADGGSLVSRVRRVVGRGSEPSPPGAGIVAAVLLLGLSGLLAVSAARTAETTPNDTDSLGGRIAGIQEAQPAPQLPRPVSDTVADTPPPEPVAQRPEPASPAPPARPVFSLEEIIRLKQFEIDTDYYDQMAAVFGGIQVEEIIALRQHEVNKRYVDEMFAEFGPLDVEEVVALKIHEVNRNYVREMSHAFHRQMDLEEVVSLRQQEVCREDVEALQESGVELDPHGMARLQSQGVDAEDLAELQDLDLRGASNEDLVHLAQLGFDANDVEGLQQVLGALSLDDATALLVLGVDESEVDQLRDMGMQHPDVDQLVHMYSQGLTADVIDTILDDDMESVPVEALVLFKELGLEEVFFPEFRRRNQ